MNKFLENLTNREDKLLGRRAENVNNRARITYESLINKIKLEMEQKNMRLQDLIDLGPSSTTSLNPVSSDWNPNEWVNEIQSLKFDIYDLQIQLKLALETFKELFVEGTEKTENITA